MTRSSLRFWIVTLATTVTMGVTASLGLWQIGRAQQKLELQARIDTASQAVRWSEADVLSAADLAQAHYRPVQLQGKWIAEASVYLDNRQMNGRPGFYLVTPLQLQGSHLAVLVQRGWAPRDFNDRSRLPDIATPAGQIVVEGRLAPPPGQLYQLGEAGQGPIRQNIDLPAFARETGLPLLPGVSVQQTAGAPDGLQRDWPVVSLGVDKHRGYAAQWFGLCALAGILYVWFQLIAPRRKRRSHVPDA
jgi:surfeit locus 1 family protein